LARVCRFGSSELTNSRHVRLAESHEALAKLNEVVEIKQNGLILFGEGLNGVKLMLSNKAATPKGPYEA
jgi:hypothetical protein